MICDALLRYKLTYRARNARKDRETIVEEVIPVAIREVDAPVAVATLFDAPLEGTVAGHGARGDQEWVQSAEMGLCLALDMGDRPLDISSIIEADHRYEDAHDALKITREVHSDRATMEAEALKRAASLGVAPDGRILVPGRGPRLAFDCVDPGLSSAIAGTTEAPRDLGRFVTPLSPVEAVPGMFGLADVGVIEDFLDMTFGLPENWPESRIHSFAVHRPDLLPEVDFEEGVVLAARQLLDSNLSNRTIGNLPYFFMEAYVAYHAPGFDCDVMSDDLEGMLRLALRDARRSEYRNDAHRRMLANVLAAEIALHLLDARPENRKAPKSSKWG